MEPKSSPLSWGTLWRIFFMGFFVWALAVAHEALLALFLAIVIAAALDRPVSFLERRKFPRVLATLAIYIAAAFIIALLVYAVIPVALAEFNHFLANVGNVSTGISSVFDATKLFEGVSHVLSRATDLLFSGTVSFFDIATRFFGSLVFLTSVFVLSFYLTINRDGVEQFLVQILPSHYEQKAVALYARVRHKIGRWLQGQLILSVIMGGLAALGLWILGAKYALLLGFVVAVLEIVPYVGPIAGGAIAVLVGLTTSFTLAFYVLILFVVIQQIESNFLVPFASRLTTTINPVVALVAILIGAKTFGIVGIFLAVPAAVLIQELVGEWSEVKQKRKEIQS